MAKKRTEDSSPISNWQSGAAGAAPARSTTPKPATVPRKAPQREAAPSGSEHEEIARLAYSYWEARGNQNGSAEEDWIRAEREIRSRKQA